MGPLRMTLAFYIDQPVPTADLDELSDLVRSAIDAKIGETDYMIQDVNNYDISFELQDDI